jgi:5-methylcytosine-specific restriction enzyme A
VPRIAKAKRQQRAHLGAKARKSRPIPGSRASGLRKRMDGTVERREK